MQKVGLVLEGGAMRCAFTAGVLDCFLDEKIYFPYVSAVSAGATNGVCYVARQKGRGKFCTIDALEQYNYISPLFYLTKQKSIMNMDLLFKDIPFEIYPLDFETYKASKTRFVMPLIDAYTGETKYVEEYDDPHVLTDYCRATCSLPFFMPPVKIGGKLYFDGGIAESIPFKKAFLDGCEKVCVILTKPAGYVRTHEKVPFMGRYPKIKDLLETRAERYNQDVLELEELEREGKALIIRPSGEIDVKRLDRDAKKLRRFYDEGVATATDMLEKIRHFCGC